MKYLKKFNEANDYKNSKLILDEFNSKKSILESIFDKKDYTISQIDADILTKVFGGKKENQNPLLSRYSNILKMKRRLDLIDGETIEDGERKKSIKKSIQDLKNQSVRYPESVDHYDIEISKLEDSIKSIDERVSDRSQELLDIQKSIHEEELEFKDMISDYSDTIKDLY
jgi:chromosome segregation ATPase